MCWFCRWKCHLRTLPSECHPKSRAMTVCKVHFPIHVKLLIQASITSTGQPPCQKAKLQFPEYLTFLQPNQKIHIKTLKIEFLKLISRWTIECTFKCKLLTAFNPARLSSIQFATRYHYHLRYFHKGRIWKRATPFLPSTHFKIILIHFIM